MLFYGTVTEATWYVIQADNTPTIERPKYLTHPDVCLRWGVGATEVEALALAELLLTAALSKTAAQKWAQLYATEIIQQLGRMWVISRHDLMQWVDARALAIQ